jgi:folate-dependent phosphoribosylglycinamide formyltransferase PurN
MHPKKQHYIGNYMKVQAYIVMSETLLRNKIINIHPAAYIRCFDGPTDIREERIQSKKHVAM